MKIIIFKPVTLTAVALSLLEAGLAFYLGSGYILAQYPKLTFIFCSFLHLMPLMLAITWQHFVLRS